jgi:alcohol dehydrogenase class IV
MDLAKAVAAVVGTDRPLASLVLGGKHAARMKPLPWIAVPTVAGTGSELSSTAVIRMAEGPKRILAHPRLLARQALCDPQLTVSKPAMLTASTAFDAAAHCIEAICASGNDPAAEAVAAEGLQLIFAEEALQNALDQPTDLSARQALMTASCLGALAFVKGLGAVHAASHAIGALDEGRLHHGTLNALLLPPVLRANRDAIVDRLPRLISAMGIAQGDDIADWIEGKVLQAGLPISLEALDIDRGALPALAESAAADICNVSNPRPMAASDYGALLASAW